MKLTYRTIKALASPTRISMLNQILDGEITPSDLSKELDKAKSTITNHANILQSANLLRKNEEDGRRRVIYEPTETARAIANGESRHVQFSITTAFLVGVMSILILAHGQLNQPSSEVRTLAAETATTNQGTTFIIVAITLLFVALAALWYTYAFIRLQDSANS